MRVRLLLASLVFGAGVFAQDTRQDTYQDLMKSGEKHRAGNEFAAALTDYRKAAGRALKPDEAARAQYRMGQMLEKLGDPDAALRSYIDSSHSFAYPDSEIAKKRLQAALAGDVMKASSIVSALHEASTKSQSVEPSIDLHINFNFGSDELSETGQKQVEELARALADPEFAPDRFEIDGHTDKIGSDKVNLELSERRARRVRDTLTAQFRMQANRFEVKGLGKTRPIRQGDSDEDNRINRRVEVKLLIPE
jgi:outer membrane protein OmpA-like peptidoglycan-associated protein